MTYEDFVDICRPINVPVAVDRAPAKRAGTVVESIYNGASVIVPLADVQHIERNDGGGLRVVTKHTRWDVDRDVWANSIFVPEAEAVEFLSMWCRYRYELEQDTIADLMPSVTEP